MPKPKSVIVGKLRAVDDDGRSLGDGLRVRLSPGVALPDGVSLGTSLTVTAVSRDEMPSYGGHGQVLACADTSFNAVTCLVGLMFLSCPTS